MYKSKFIDNILEKALVWTVLCDSASVFIMDYCAVGNQTLQLLQHKSLFLQRHGVFSSGHCLDI